MKTNAKPIESNPEELSLFLQPFSLDFLPDRNSRSKSHFQFAFWFVGPKKRRALNDLYAYCRLLDDLADEEQLDRNLRASAIEEVRGWVKAGEPVGHPFWDRFLEEIKAFHISKDSLMGIIEGVKTDFEKTEFEDWKDLERYCYGVACCVGQAVLAILGARGKQAEDYAYQMGCCLQFLNIMRDLEEDQNLGRSYVPKSLVERYAHIKGPEYNRQLRENLYLHAMEYRRKAVPFSWRCLPAELMAAIYIRGSNHYWRWGNPKRLSKREKFMAAIPALLKTTLS